MSTNSKGNKHEREAVALYESWGFQTWRPVGVRRPYSKDIAGAFDLMAWTEKELHLVQVKSDPSDASKARKKINTLGLPRGSIVPVVLMRIPRQPHRFRGWVMDSTGDWVRIPEILVPEGGVRPGP